MKSNCSTSNIEEDIKYLKKHAIEFRTILSQEASILFISTLAVYGVEQNMQKFALFIIFILFVNKLKVIKDWRTFSTIKNQIDEKINKIDIDEILKASLRSKLTKCSIEITSLKNIFSEINFYTIAFIYFFYIFSVLHILGLYKF